MLIIHADLFDGLELANNFGYPGLDFSLGIKLTLIWPLESLPNKIQCFTIRGILTYWILFHCCCLSNGTISYIFFTHSFVSYWRESTTYESPLRSHPVKDPNSGPITWTSRIIPDPWDLIEGQLDFPTNLKLVAPYILKLYEGCLFLTWLCNSSYTHIYLCHEEESGGKWLQSALGLA